MCQFAQAVGCVVSSTLPGCAHTSPVGRAPVGLSAHVFTCFVLSLASHTASPPFRIKLTEPARGLFRRCSLCDADKHQKMRLSVQIFARWLPALLLPQRGRCFMGTEVLGGAANRTYRFGISLCVHLNHRPKGCLPERSCILLCVRGGELFSSCSEFKLLLLMRTRNNPGSFWV